MHDPAARVAPATDQETPVDEAETVALPAPETSDAKIPFVAGASSCHPVG